MRATVVIAAALLGCASASDVDVRGRAVLDATDPEKLGYCPAAEIARARSEVAIARAASERGEPVEAAKHLSVAEELAAAIAAQAPTCGHTRVPNIPLDPPEPKPADGDHDGDGLSDVIDKCPTEPEDIDDFEDLDGCPEPGP